MYQVTKAISFCYGHRLLNYQGKCRHLHGHNARAIITLQSERLDDLGMVVDFTDIKQVVSPWLDGVIDHTLLLHKDDPLIPILEQAGERFHVMADNPTAENIARLIYDFVAEQGYPVTEVMLWETDTSYASYRP
jgi:6-pyruvoyltetrahydropterin/6-carboxytetrahydropterin synthase